MFHFKPAFCLPRRPRTSSNRRWQLPAIEGDITNHSTAVSCESPRATHVRHCFLRFSACDFYFWLVCRVCVIGKTSFFVLKLTKRRVFTRARFFFSFFYWNLLFFHCIRERKNTKVEETSVEKDPAVCWCAVIRKLVRTGVSPEVKSFDSTAAEGRSRHGSPSIRIVANLIFYAVDTWGWIIFFVVPSSWRHRRSLTAAMMETWGFWNIVHSIDAVLSLSTINDVSPEWIF